LTKPNETTHGCYPALIPVNDWSWFFQVAVAKTFVDTRRLISDSLWETMGFPVNIGGQSPTLKAGVPKDG